MNFKGSYGAGESRLCSFYWSDLRNLIKLLRDNPFTIDDAITNTFEWYSMLLYSQSTMFFTAKHNKKVIGYVFFDTIAPRRFALFNAFFRRKTLKEAAVCGRLALKFGFETWDLDVIGAVTCTENRAA